MRLPQADPRIVKQRPQLIERLRAIAGARVIVDEIALRAFEFGRT